jgi:hypothetical protein
MTIPGATESEPGSGYIRLGERIHWYDAKSAQAQRGGVSRCLRSIASVSLPIGCQPLES